MSGNKKWLREGHPTLLLKNTSPRNHKRDAHTGASDHCATGGREKTSTEVKENHFNAQKKLQGKRPVPKVMLGCLKNKSTLSKEILRRRWSKPLNFSASSSCGGYATSGYNR